MFMQNGVETAIHRLQAFLPSFSRLLVILLGYGAALGLTRSGIFSPRHFRLRKKGLDLLLAGKPIEAEKCYRVALDIGANVPEADRVRLMVCLGDALIDQRRYQEAMQYLTQALELGDPSGSGEGSMCDVLLCMHQSPEKAIEMADEAMQLVAHEGFSQAFGVRWAAIFKDLYEAKTWARKTQALLMLGQKTEAQQAVDRAVRIVEMSKPELQKVMPVTSLAGRLVLGNRLRRQKELTISDTHWQIGLSLLAMHDNVRAAEHFLVARDTDRMGKYRSLAQEQLDKLGYADRKAQ